MKRLSGLWSALKRLANQVAGPAVPARGIGLGAKLGLVPVPVPAQVARPQVRRLSLLLALSAGLVFSAGSAQAQSGVQASSGSSFPTAETRSAVGTPALPAVFSKTTPEGLDDLRDLQDHVQQLVERLKPATVHVSVGGAQGSGVIVNKDGYILTAGHVSGKPGSRAVVTLHDGSRLKAVALGRNETVDSGMLKITESGSWPVAELGSGDSLYAGQWCLALGHPGGYFPDREAVVRLGRISRIDDTVLRTDCTLVGGDSGGPLFDMHGRVIGIHSRIAAPTSANFHVPVEIYRETWQRLAASEEWNDEAKGAVIGIRGEDDEKGCLVTEVFPNLPADKAGIRAGDIITRFDGSSVQSLAGLIQRLNKREAGQRVELQFLRDGRSQSVTVTLASR